MHLATATIARVVVGSEEVCAIDPNMPVPHDQWQPKGHRSINRVKSGALVAHGKLLDDHLLVRAEDLYDIA